MIRVYSANTTNVMTWFARLAAAVVVLAAVQTVPAQPAVAASWSHPTYYARPGEIVHLTLTVTALSHTPQSITLSLPPEAVLMDMDTNQQTNQRTQYLNAPRPVVWQVQMPEASGRYLFRAGDATTTVIVRQRMPSLGYYSAGRVQLIDGLGRGSIHEEFTLADPAARVIVGDWNGDNFSQIGIVAAGSITIGEHTIALAGADDLPEAAVPLAGDWDGDGVDSLALFASGQFVLFNPDGNRDIIVTYTPVVSSAADSIPLAGDWNGDGIDSIGMYSSGLFYLRRTTAPDSDEIIIEYGAKTHALPLIADWNGDRVDTPAVIQGDTLLLLDRLTPGNATAVIPLRRLVLRKVLVGYWQGADFP